jgi:hypothetical protein
VVADADRGLGALDLQRRAVVIAFALTVALMPATVIDRTLSCQVLQEGQAHMVGVDGSVTTPQTSAYFKFWPTPLGVDQPAVQPGVEVDTQPAKVVWDPRGRCEPSTRRIALTPHRLKQQVVATPHFLGAVAVRCHASATRVRFRARILELHGKPTRVQLIVVTDQRSKPLLYAEWTPSRVVVRSGSDCES